jgi:hypothetical protein
MVPCRLWRLAPLSCGRPIPNPYHRRLYSSTGILPVSSMGASAHDYRRYPRARWPCYEDGPAGGIGVFGRSMQSDRLLLRKASRGCKDSLRRIYESHKDHLLTLARAMTVYRFAGYQRREGAGADPRYKSVRHSPPAGRGGGVGDCSMRRAGQPCGFITRPRNRMLPEALSRIRKRKG